VSKQVSNHAPKPARVLSPRPPAGRPDASTHPVPQRPDAVAPARPVPQRPDAAPAPREPLWRDLVGEVLRRERLAQRRTLKDVAEAARISMPYLSEVERGRKEASSEVLAAAARALGLGLGDLLARTHGELVRVTSRAAHQVRPVRTAPRASRDGLCLAA
jgi:transcriptional regulator with XRE-family HTH domain